MLRAMIVVNSVHDASNLVSLSFFIIVIRASSTDRVPDLSSHYGVNMLACLLARGQLQKKIQNFRIRLQV